MHTLNSTLRSGSPLRQATGALILIHGRGSSPDDILRLASALEVDGYALLAPAAEGGTWYPQRFLAPLAQNEPGLSRAFKSIDSTVDEITSAGVPTSRIGIIGFSQGACLALEHTSRSANQYAFTAGLSGALIGPVDTPRPAHNLRRIPILLGCAEADAHIPRAFVEHSATLLTEMNADVTKQIFPGSGHTVFPQEVVWINQQLARVRGSKQTHRDIISERPPT
jgi:phospholipase/carboxylesterase